MRQQSRQATRFVRANGLAGTWVTTVGLTLALCAGPLAAAPFVPETSGEVLERLPVSTNSQLRELRELRKALETDPQDLDLAVDLATRYLRLGRAEADPRYYGYAQAALRPWWEQPPARVLVLRAVMRQARHDFNGALTDLRRVIELQPGNAQAWLSKSVIHRVRGDYAKAMQSCGPLFRLRRRLMATACATSAAALFGQAEQSYRLLEVELGGASTVGTAQRLCVVTLLAEMAVGLGRERVAERHFQTALSLGKRSTAVLSAYADLMLDQGRAEEVQRLLGASVKVDGLLLRLAIAERRLGSPELADHIKSLRARFTSTRSRGDPAHLRSEARFALHVLDRPNEALPLAQASWQRQKEPWDARLLLEAALASGRREAAKPVLERLARDRTEHIGLRRLVARFEAAER